MPALVNTLAPPNQREPCPASLDIKQQPAKYGRRVAYSGFPERTVS